MGSTAPLTEAPPHASSVPDKPPGTPSHQATTGSASAGGMAQARRAALVAKQNAYLAEYASLRSSPNWHKMSAAEREKARAEIKRKHVGGAK